LAPRPPEAGRLRWKYRLACRGSYDSGDGLPGPPPPPPSGESVDVWRPALSRWDVPWQWPTVSLTMVACALSALLAGKVEQSVLDYLGYQAGEATIDEKAGVLFLEQLYGSDFFFLCMDTATQLIAHLLIDYISAWDLLVSSCVQVQ
uniref:Uncharacterized protein n=1 Tax=Aegilops tauschii subsp. strangulata TaxID=200361 RepID=A0A453R029_AEGTS